ncbi:lytic transglycosylase domain-containing protein [Phaeodactylibacter luteus]|nr:lytic transglycosylase domain-containing protein [Phaeodactylibacter luteus]
MDSQYTPMPLFLLLMLLLATGLNATLAAATPAPEYNEEEVISRLQEIEDPLFELKYNSVVGGYIRGYLYRNSRHKAQLVTGRALLYFPIMEKYLAEQGVPEKLKYLSVVESALNPHAVSRVGAVGLWQFMPGTGQDYGLAINDYVDERKDPHKSTQAAIAYLKKAYDKYGDWALALAAYNGGSGRVARAIKRGRSKDFWKIRRYMPRETRNYVPAYIGATYLMEYYKAYGVQPAYPELDLQITGSVKVYDAISFYRVAQLTGLSLDYIRKLNPSYKRDLLPRNEEGNFLILPKRVLQAVTDYLEAQRPDHLADAFFAEDRVEAAPPAPEQYQQTSYYVSGTETLPEVAKKLNCSVHQLAAWNQLQSDSLWAGQELLVFFPREIRRFQPMSPMPPLPDIRRLPVPKGPLRPLCPSPAALPVVGKWYYTLRNRQTVADLSQQLPFLDPDAVARLNGVEQGDKLPRGTLLRLN